MFSKTITNSSQFLMMPSSSQNLYFHIGMNADDDGFCEHFAVMRMTDSKPDDLKILQAKGFVNVFDDRVLIILDWKENNYLRPDRYTPSKYLDVYRKELKRLSSGIPKVDTGKDRLGEDREGKEKKETVTIVAKSDTPFSLKEEIEKLYESTRRDLNIIALYLEERNPDLKNKEQFNAAIKRHIKPAIALKSFTDNQILKAVSYAKKEYKDVWTIETLIKILTK